MIKRTKRNLLLAPFLASAVALSLAVAAYACTNYVGVLDVWGNNGTSSQSGNPVIVTGNDAWNGLQGMNQSVNATVVSANKYTSGTTCGTNRGCFWVKTAVSGTNSFNPTSSAIWYDVNTIPVGYTSHTTWGGDPTYDCMTWNLNAFGVKNVGSVSVNTSGLITSATNGSQGSGSSVTVSSNVAGPFYISTNETSANTSPKESGICLSDSTSTNGDQAPVTLI